MAVHIRLTRVGATRRPSYRVIAIDSRRSRDGRALEILGFYDPLTDPITVKLDDERIANWMARGALPSAAVQRLMKVAVAGPVLKRKPAPAAAEGVTAKPRRASRAKQPAAEAAEAVAETAAQTAPPETAEVTAETTPQPTAESTAETAAETAAETEQATGEPAAETEPEAAAEAVEAEAEPAQPEAEPVEGTEQAEA
ncbi:MAG TPA: 30S ribosomal protein S16 [Candidatus Limnocylindria bacterium]